MIQFILNNSLIETELLPSTILLDFIRSEKKLKGTKAGCREGDCGACTVLVGSLNDDKMTYHSMASCLTPIGNIAGRHVVTVEGINNFDEMTPIQKVLHEHGGTQCGFCTPGFVVSLTGFTMSGKEKNRENAINSVAGNICRCTGYKSIERAIDDITLLMKDAKQDNLEFLVEKRILPEYFKSIPDRLRNLNSCIIESGEFIVGGGTDLYVQKPNIVSKSEARFYLNKAEMKSIIERDGTIEIGASVTVNDIIHSEIFLRLFPSIKEKFKLISSEQIRNVATIGGNIVNASPIGDLSIFFLALDSFLILSDRNGSKREVPLQNFFKSYKTLDLREGEYIERLVFSEPEGQYYFNFEKVSKRNYLDIASVNTAILYYLTDDKIDDIHISGGGVAPVPKYFEKTRLFMLNKELNKELIEGALDILISEVSPISDIRGSKAYKTLLLKQLFLSHFIHVN